MDKLFSSALLAFEVLGAISALILLGMFAYRKADEKEKNWIFVFAYWMLIAWIVLTLLFWAITAGKLVFPVKQG